MIRSGAIGASPPKVAVVVSVAVAIAAAIAGAADRSRGSSFSKKSFAFLSALAIRMDAIADTFSLAFHTSPLLSGIALTAAVWYVLVTLRTMSSGKVAASAASGVQRQEAMLRARELQQQRPPHQRGRHRAPIHRHHRESRQVLRACRR